VRIVLDTSVLVAALRSPGGASDALLQLALERGFKLLLSVALVLEYEAVLTRPEHRQRAQLSVAEIGEIVDALCLLGSEVVSHFNWRPQLSNPDDEMVLDLAIHGEAKAIVTFNRADFAEAAHRFGIEIWSPREALERLRNETK
jgi:putative PIN family toxin of toxin-antitoxin system